MEREHHLAPKLRTLRLSGILESLEMRNRQAIEESLSFVEFLERLVEDEIERRSQKQLHLRLRRSGLEDSKTLESFDFAFNTSVNKKQLFDLATCQFVERAQSVFLVGQAGVGKTHLAHALGHEACRRGYDVSCVRLSKMLQHLGGGRADGSYQKRLASYLRPDLLIVDDFGLKPMRPPGPEDFYEVISERYERASIIITTNRAPEEWPGLFAEPILASAALDRLAHGAHLIEITGESYRSKGPRGPKKQDRRKEAS